MLVTEPNYCSALQEWQVLRARPRYVCMCEGEGSFSHLNNSREWHKLWFTHSDTHTLLASPVKSCLNTPPDYK